MAHWVSFDAIKEEVSFDTLLERYGLMSSATTKHTEKGTELRLSCPFHEDATPSLSVNVRRGIFYCFGCRAKGDVVDFAAMKEGIAGSDRNQNRRSAALLMQQWFGISPEEKPKKQAKKPKQPQEQVREEPPAKEEAQPAKEEKAVESTTPVEEETEALHNPPLGFTLQKLDYAHPYLVERGLAKETIDTFGIGYHGGKGMMAGRVVIPIHNEQSVLVAYAGRWPGDEGWPEGESKYKLPPGFHKSLVVFNLHRAREHAAEGLIVVEGFFDCMDLWQRGRKNVVALMGCAMSQAQERLIVETVGPRGRVLLALDPDEAGRNGSADGVQRLVSQVFVREVVLPVRGSQ